MKLMLKIGLTFLLVLIFTASSSIGATFDEEQKAWNDLKQRIKAESEANGLKSLDSPGPYRDRFWDVEQRGEILPNGSSAVSMKGGRTLRYIFVTIM